MTFYMINTKRSGVQALLVSWASKAATKGLNEVSMGLGALGGPGDAPGCECPAAQLGAAEELRQNLIKH